MKEVIVFAITSFCIYGIFIVLQKYLIINKK